MCLRYLFIGHAVEICNLSSSSCQQIIAPVNTMIAFRLYCWSTQTQFRNSLLIFLNIF